MKSKSEIIMPTTVSVIIGLVLLVKQILNKTGTLKLLWSIVLICLLVSYLILVHMLFKK